MKQDVKEGDLMTEYCGEVRCAVPFVASFLFLFLCRLRFAMCFVQIIDDAECNRRLDVMGKQGETNFYLFKVSNRMVQSFEQRVRCILTVWCSQVIDAGGMGNHARFINHSCDPNCITQKWLVLWWRLCL